MGYPGYPGARGDPGRKGPNGPKGFPGPDGPIVSLFNSIELIISCIRILYRATLVTLDHQERKDPLVPRYVSIQNYLYINALIRIQKTIVNCIH